MQSYDNAKFFLTQKFISIRDEEQPLKAGLLVDYKHDECAIDAGNDCVNKVIND